MDLYQHFRPEEKPVIREMLGWADVVKTRYIPKRSDFLDPREQDIARSVIGSDPDVTLSFWGGSEHAERQRLLLTPPYGEPADSDYGLVLFSLDYPSKFNTLNHPDLLGALMNLGLRREKFGDLLQEGDEVQMVAAEEVAAYIQFHLTQVGKSPVTLREIPLSDMLQVTQSWDETNSTVSSLRLDAVAAQIYHVSRGKMGPLIQKGFVKVNWKVIEQPAFLLKEGDHVSIRGMGRSKLIAVCSKTKKDKWRIITGKLSRK